MVMLCLLMDNRTHRVCVQEQSADMVKPKNRKTPPCRGQKSLAVNSDSMKVTTHMVNTPKCSVPSQAEPVAKVHELLCDRIRQLEMELQKRGKIEQIEGATYASHLSIHHRAKLRDLIRKKMHCGLFL